MSQVFPSSGPAPQESFQEKHPFLIIAIGGIIALVLLALVSKKRQSSPPTDQATSGDTSGLSFDANGKPILYVPTDQFLNYNYDSETSVKDRQVTNNNSDNTTIKGMLPMPPMQPWHHDPTGGVAGVNGPLIPTGAGL